MKKFSEKLLKEVTAKVKSAAVSTNTARYELAVELFEAKHIINWGLSTYGSWKNFCTQELRILTHSLIMRYVTAMGKAKKFKYTDKECRYMIQELGWNRFITCILLQKRRMDPKGFVKRYYDFDTNAQRRSRKTPGGDRAYTFALPVESADVLDGYLLNLGMTVGPNGGRKGVREAVIKLIATELES